MKFYYLLCLIYHLSMCRFGFSICVCTCISMYVCLCVCVCQGMEYRTNVLCRSKCYFLCLFFTWFVRLSTIKNLFWEGVAGHLREEVYVWVSFCVSGGKLVGGGRLGQNHEPPPLWSLPPPPWSLPRPCPVLSPTLKKPMS